MPGEASLEPQFALLIILPRLGADDTAPHSRMPVTIASSVKVLLSPVVQCLIIHLVLLYGMPIDNTTSKFTVSVPSGLAKFIEQYQKNHQIASRSEVIARGLQSLRDAELAAAYQDHAKAWQKDSEREFWDRAALDDGIDDEESRW